MAGIKASPFSIHVVRDSVVTLLPFTVKVPRLEMPLSPGPIFFASLSAKWHMAHFFSNTSLPRVAEPAAAWLAAFFELFFAGESCARSAPATAKIAIPRINTFRFTMPPRLTGRYRQIMKPSWNTTILSICGPNFHPIPVTRYRFLSCTPATFALFTLARPCSNYVSMIMETLTRSWEVLQDAYQAQMEGDYDRAVELYQSSLELHPTAAP